MVRFVGLRLRLQTGERLAALELPGQLTQLRRTERRTTVSCGEARLVRDELVSSALGAF